MASPVASPPVSPTVKYVVPEVNLDKQKITQLENELNRLKNSSTNISENSRAIANKYLETLIIELSEKGILNTTDINNIKIKLNSKLLTVDEILLSLETLKKEGKVNKNDDSIYNELPAEFYAPLANKKLGEWDNDYTILNTTKWQVPMARPPVCVSSTPCQVCPTDSSNYPVNLKSWDNSRQITQSSNINKKWIANQ